MLSPGLSGEASKTSCAVANRDTWRARNSGNTHVFLYVRAPYIIGADPPASLAGQSGVRARTSLRQRGRPYNSPRAASRPTPKRRRRAFRQRQGRVPRGSAFSLCPLQCELLERKKRRKSLGARTHRCLFTDALWIFDRAHGRRLSSGGGPCLQGPGVQTESRIRDPLMFDRKGQSMSEKRTSRRGPHRRVKKKLLRGVRISCSPRNPKLPKLLPGDPVAALIAKTDREAALAE